MKRIFFILSAVLFVVLFLSLNRSAVLHNPVENSPTSEDLLKTDPVALNRLYTLHHFVDELFEKEKIPYFAIAGTLLGAVRHGGIIPWDDDLDAGIFEEDLERIHALKTTFNKNGYAIVPFGGGIKIYCKEGGLIKNPEKDSAFYEWKYPWIDLFLMEIDGDGKIVYATERLRESPMGKKEWFYQEDVVAGLKRLPFGPTTIPVPSQWIDYLNRVYGPDWNRVAYKDYDHAKEQHLEKIAVPIVNFRLNLPREASF